METRDGWSPQQLPNTTMDLTHHMPLTPLRLQNGDSEVFKMGLQVAAWLGGLLLFFVTVWDLVGKGLPLSEVLLSLPGRAFFVGLSMLALFALIYAVNGGGIPGSRTRPYWIEISDQLSYQNSRGLSRVDWVDVESMHFDYSHIYQSDDPLPHDGYTTYLIITLATYTRLHIQVGNVEPSAARCVDRILKTLGRGLSASQSKTRQGAVMGLVLTCINNT